MPSFAVLKGTPEGIKKEQTQKPDLQADQVLVKVTASGLCGTDLHYRQGWNSELLIHVACTDVSISR